MGLNFGIFSGFNVNVGMEALTHGRYQFWFNRWIQP